MIRHGQVLQQWASSLTTLRRHCVVRVNTNLMVGVVRSSSTWSTLLTSKKSIDFSPKKPNLQLSKEQQIEQNQDHISGLLKMLEELLKDPVKMKAMKMPRSFPYYEKKERLVRHISPNGEISLQENILHIQKRNENQSQLVEFTKLVSKVQNGESVIIFNMYFENMSARQTKEIKHMVLEKSQRDPNFFENQIMKVMWKVHGNIASNSRTRAVFDPTSYYETIVASCFYEERYDRAVQYHKSLYPSIMRESTWKINWLPIILSAMLNSSMESLDALMKIHYTLDMKRDGFFEYIVPFLASNLKNTYDATTLAKWMYTLTKLNDIPVSSDPVLSDSVKALLDNGFDRSALYVFYELQKDKNAAQVTVDGWASEEFIHLMMRGVNFDQTKDKVRYIYDLVNLFDAYEYITTESFWFNFLKIIQFDKVPDEKRLIKIMTQLMSEYGIKESLNIHLIKCIKTRDNDQFLKYFDSLLNFHESLQAENTSVLINPRVLGKFITILMTNTSEQDGGKDAGNHMIEEPFLMLTSYAASYANSNAKTSVAFFSACFELTKGFLKGLINSDAISKYEKLDYLIKLENFIYDEFAVQYQKSPGGVDQKSRKYIFKLESEIIKFKLSMGQFDESIIRLQKLLDNDEYESKKSTTSGSLANLDPHLASHLCSVLSAQVQRNMKSAQLSNSGSISISHSQAYLEQMIAYNNNITLKTLKILTRMKELDVKSVPPNAWALFLTTAAKVRPFAEVEYLIWWLVRNVGQLDAHTTRVKVTHVSHPLRQIFSPYHVSRLLKGSFTNINTGSKEEPYQPWRTLQLLLHISDVAGVFIDDNIIKKDLLWGLNNLYVVKAENQDSIWQDVRLKNDLSFDEMMSRFNEIWTANYTSKLEDSS